MVKKHLSSGPNLHEGKFLVSVTPAPTINREQKNKEGKLRCVWNKEYVKTPRKGFAFWNSTFHCGRDSWETIYPTYLSLRQDSSFMHFHLAIFTNVSLFLSLLSLSHSYHRSTFFSKHWTLVNNILVSVILFYYRFLSLTRLLVVACNTLSCLVFTQPLTEMASTVTLC